MYCNLNNYHEIGKVGNVNTVSPLSTCLFDTIETSFNNGISSNVLGPECKECQMYMSDRCSKHWDESCEYAYNNKNVKVPNLLDTCEKETSLCQGLTFGQILLRNTAKKKYLYSINGRCNLKSMQFNPLDSNSPMLYYWDPIYCNGSRSQCTPVYKITDPSNIDTDVVMNKILQQPYVAMDILLNIYNTAVRENTLHTLKGTMLYNFFMTKYFQNENNKAIHRAQMLF